MCLLFHPIWCRPVAHSSKSIRPRRRRP